MFLVGCSMGFIEHYWYRWLDRMYVGRTMKAVARKVVVDQIICAPSIGLWYFLGENYDCQNSACLFSPLLFTHTIPHYTTNLEVSVVNLSVFLPVFPSIYRYFGI